MDTLYGYEVHFLFAGIWIYEPTLAWFPKEGGLIGRSTTKVAKGILYCDEEPITVVDSSLDLFSMMF